MKLLLTGASGFLGNAVGRAALAAGHDVRSAGRRPLAWPGGHAIATEPDVMRDVVATFTPDAVLHFAGSASVGASLADPLADFRASTALWLEWLDAIRRSGARPLVVLASSAAVYGAPEILPTPEDAPRAPQSPYGYHKLMSELAAEEFATSFGLDVLALRYFSVFGPAQRRLLVWEIAEQLRAGNVRLKGTGDERRDFLPCAEAAAATLAVVERLAAASRPAGFRALNIASGASASVRDVAEILRAAIRPAATISFAGQPLPGNPPRWEADVTALRAVAPAWAPAPLPASLAACAAAWNPTHPSSARPLAGILP